MTPNDEIFRAPADVWARLAANLPPDCIEWRQDGKPINRDGKFFARFVAYVEAGTVRERLDSIVPGEWDLNFEALPLLVAEEGSETLVAFKAKLQVLGVVREDVGQGRDYKSAATDAFKRAAVRYGIGHELYEMPLIWVQLDGDGKYAKPVEDPAAVYARKITNPPNVAPSSNPPKQVPGGEAERPVPDLDEETCPKCGGRMFDNRRTKRNPRAPDFKCRNRSCDGVIWPSGKVSKQQLEQSGAPGFDEVPIGIYGGDDELPF